MTEVTVGNGVDLSHVKIDSIVFTEHQMGEPQFDNGDFLDGAVQPPGFEGGTILHTTPQHYMKRTTKWA